MKTLEMRIYDRLKATVISEDDRILYEYDTHWSNGLTYVGLARVVGLMLHDVGGSTFDYIAIGSYSGEFDPNQTSLGNELARQRAVESRTTTDFENDTAVWEAVFENESNISYVICESGVFSEDNVMLCRKTMDPLVLNPGDSLKITWYVKVVIV